MSVWSLEEIVEQKTAESRSLPALKQPRKYKVILLNDDYTPMVFVVDVLKRFFHLNEELAIRVMLQVHVLGKGICGVFTKEIAETKVALVNDHARSNQHPLLCTMEPE
jgi:ATP-dependent Clp protease adaptor protein ClpS